MLQPEQLVRKKIDALLEAAGWVIQDPDRFNRNAAVGVAVREFQLPIGAADYLLFVQGKAAGVIEAKRAGATLSGVADQSGKYQVGVPAHLAHWQSPLPFNYESTGEETRFCDTRDPRPHSRRVFAFHKPETLLAWLKQGDSLAPAWPPYRHWTRAAFATVRSRPSRGWKHPSSAMIPAP